MQSPIQEVGAFLLLENPDANPGGPLFGARSISSSVENDHAARRSNQSILKEITPMEGLMLKLQLCIHLMRRTDLLEKTLMLGKIEGRKRRGRQRIR